MTDYQAGTAYLQLLPSLSGFPEALEAKLKGINPEIHVKVKPDVDTTGLDTSASESGQSAGKKYSDAFTQMVQGRIRAALDALPAIKPDVDATEAQAAFAELRAELETLAQQRIGVDIDPADALVKVAEIRDALAAMELEADRGIDVRVDASEASAKLDALLAQVKDLDKTNDIHVKLDEGDYALAAAQLEKLKAEANIKGSVSEKNNGGGSPPGAGGGRLGYLAMLGGVGGTLGAGAISSAALLAIPVAFAAIGVAAEKSDASVKVALNDITTAGKQAAQQGFSPLIGVIQKFSLEAVGDIQQLKPQFAEIGTATAPLVATLGTGLLNAVKNGVGDSVPILNNIKPVISSLAGGFGQLEKGVTGFLGTLDAKTSGNALTGLFSVVQTLLPDLAKLLNAVAPLGTALTSVLGSSISSVSNTFGAFGAVLHVAGAALQSVSGFLGAQAPVLLALGVTVKLLSGSWTNLSGAWSRAQSIGTSLVGLFNTQSTSFAKLASITGVTTAAENQRQAAAAKSTAIVAEADAAEAALAKSRAQTAADTAAETAAEAASVAARDKSTAATAASVEASLEADAAKGALAKADIALTAAEEEAAVATAAAAETVEVATFSFAPLLGLLGAAAAAFGLWGLQSRSAKQPVQDVSSQIIQMGRAVSDTSSVLSSSSDDTQKYASDLEKVGSSVGAFSAAFSGSLQQAQQYTDGLTSAQKKLGDQVITTTATVQNFDSRGDPTSKTVQTVSESVKDLASTVNGNASAFAALNPQQQRAVTQYDALNAIVPQAKNALAGTRAEAQTTTAALNAQGVTLTQTQQFWNSYGNALTQNVKNFNTATAGIKSITDNTVAADQTYFQDLQNKQQLNAAVTQAQQALAQSSQGVASAQNGVLQASQGVASALHQEQQAADGVVQAQQQVVQAKQQEVQSEQQLTQAQQQQRQAQVALTQARVQAAQTLQDLKRQVTDQGDTEDDARVRLVQAQQAVVAAGLQHTTLASLGAPSTSNLNSYQLLLQQQEAQHNLNDVLAQSAQLKQQQTAADRAGVNGSSAVVQANQQLVQANQQVQQASQGVVQAKQGVASASKGVTDAQYQEQQATIAAQNAEYSAQQASQALTNAKQSQHTASVALKTAKDNDTTSTKLNTLQGAQNFQMIENLFEANFTASGDIGEATQATIIQGQQMGITAGQVQGVIDKVTGLNGEKAVFGVVGQPSVDLSQLINAAAKQGLDPTTLGFKPSQVGNARASGSGIFPTHGAATGGLLRGPGTGTSDSIMGMDLGGVPTAWVSNGEYVVNARSTAAHMPLLEAINSAPGHASGGPVGTGQSILASNIMLAEVGGMFDAARNAYGLSGVAPNPGALPALAHTNPAVSTAGISGAGAAGGSPISYAAGAGVAQWASDILAALKMLGQPASWLGTVERRMNQESGGNPNAINLWDSNAAAGHPSQGLMQTIPSTFQAYRSALLPNNILNPEANIYAGLNYAVHRYGTLSALDRPGGYAGGGVVEPLLFDEGGMMPPGMNVVYNGLNRPEPLPNADMLYGGAGRGGFNGPMQITGQLTVNGLDAHIDGRIEAADNATGQLIASGTR